jgi:hypothetical protein
MARYVKVGMGKRMAQRPVELKEKRREMFPPEIAAEPKDRWEG